MEESKFNFEEEIKKDQAVEQSKSAMKQDARGFITSMIKFLNELLDFRHDTDRDATIEAIKGDIAFKGATAWILICSIFVASVGLNANSTAVVIGAMLISPLMGPILGVGMAIAINDIDTLRRSLINLATMIVLSLITAFLFFYLFPLSEDTSELLGRTSPDIRDVLIAFFGGLALIIARTKKGTIASVIFGVAIATALMPPLCTAGYGLAKALSGETAVNLQGEIVTGWDYALGAMYLFTINTIFIALATFMVLKVLRFPMLKYANSKKRKRIANLAMTLAIVVMIPATWTFINVLKESGYESDYKKFIDKNITNNDEVWMRRDVFNMKEKSITLYFNGDIDDAFETGLRNNLKDRSVYPSIYDFNLSVDGDKRRSYDMLLNQLDRTYERIEVKDSTITQLNRKLDSLMNELSLKSNILNTDDFMDMAKDVKIKFSDLETLGFAKMLLTSDFINTDTLAITNLKWNATLNDSIKGIREKELSDWLKQQLNLKEVLLIREN